MVDPDDMERELSLEGADSPAPTCSVALRYGNELTAMACAPLPIAAQLLLAGDDDRRHGLFHIHNPYDADVVG